MSKDNKALPSEEREGFAQWFAHYCETNDRTPSMGEVWDAARQSAGATCPHGVDDGACKQCYADATGQDAAYSAPFTTDVPQCCGDPKTCNDPCQEYFCYCNNKISLQMVSGGAAKEGLYGRVTLKIGDEYIEYIRSQPAESKRVELTPTDIRAIANSYDLDNAPQIVEFSRALLARDQAKGE